MIAPNIKLKCEHSDGGREECEAFANTLILSTTYDEDYPEPEERPELTIYPVCEDHAPEDVHAVKCSCSPDEYIVITVDKWVLRYNEGGGA